MFLLTFYALIVSQAYNVIAKLLVASGLSHEKIEALSNETEGDDLQSSKQKVRQAVSF